MVRGENVMAGYWRNEEATAATIKDGWLYTGDLGHMDADGYLYVLGRVKSLLINGTGEKYSPEGIEEALVSGSPFIEQVMLHNDHDPYTVALIVPNREALRTGSWKEGLGLRPPRMRRNPPSALFQAEIDSFRTGAPGTAFSRRNGSLRPSPFWGRGSRKTNHLLNSSLKLVRRKVREISTRTAWTTCILPRGKTLSTKRNRRIISRTRRIGPPSGDPGKIACLIETMPSLSSTNG